MHIGPVCGIQPGQDLSEVSTSALELLLKQFGRNGGERLEQEDRVERELSRRKQVT